MIYTTQRRRFVYDTWDNGSRLDGVMVECTLSITHCLRLNLQLHAIDLVRTCLISSFCTVAWQLARFQLTRRIARSLGDCWASCLLQDWLHGFRWLFTDTSEHIRHCPLPLRYTTVLCFAVSMHLVCGPWPEWSRRSTDSKCRVTDDNYPAHNRPVVGWLLV